MKPIFLLFFVSSISIASIVDEQHEGEARVVKVLGPNYDGLLKLTPSAKEVFDDMFLDVLDGHMTENEMISVLDHIAPDANSVLLPLATPDASTRSQMKKIITDLQASGKVQKTGDVASNLKMDEKKLELTKKDKKIESSSSMGFLATISKALNLEKEEAEVIGDMVADLVDGQMSAQEFLDVLSHTSPSTHAALTRVVNSLTIDDFKKLLKLDKEDKEVMDSVEDMLHEVVHEQMNIAKFLSVLEYASPSAHRFLQPFITDLQTRVANLKGKEAKEFVKKVTKALREVGKTLFAEKDGEISRAQRDKEVMVQLINTVRDYGAMARDSEAANEEIRETFPDVLQMAQAAAINRSQMGGYL